jgi:hypothetical protein
MNKKTRIILRSFARVSVLPILVFTISAWGVLKFVEPGTYPGSCIDYTEESKTDLFGAIYLMLFYLGTTPIVLLNFNRQILKKKSLRISILLIPLVPVLIGLVILYSALIDYDARVFIYLAITTTLTAVIIIWNARAVNRELKN